MKKTAIISTAILAAFISCSRMDELQPQGNIVLTEQLQQTNTVIPSRADASFNGMFTMLGSPGSVTGSTRPDDFGFIMMAFSNDLEAADIVTANSGYNWFSTCGALTSRNGDYANPYIRYAAPYNEIAAANEIISTYDSNSPDKEVIYKLAQAHAIRAFSYLNLAPYFQFRYETSSELPCVQLVTEKTVEFTKNPRASVAQIYELILNDLDWAIDNLEGFARPDKSRIDRQTAVYYLACFLINDPIYWQLGGPDQDGKDMTSEISYLILDAAEIINTSLNITVRVHDCMDEGLMHKAVGCLVRCRNGWPRFSGDQKYPQIACG